MSIPPTAEKRKKVPRTYDIFEDQIVWLGNQPSMNKSGKIRELLDDFINSTNEIIIDNLKDEIISLNAIIEIKDKKFSDMELEHIEELREIMEEMAAQKAVIVALGEKQ